MTLTAEQLQRLRAEPATGNRVGAAVRLAGITQTQLAEALDEANSYVSDLARGRYNSTTVAKAHKFAEFFGCSIEDLFPATSEAKAS